MSGQTIRLSLNSLYFSFMECCSQKFPLSGLREANPVAVLANTQPGRCPYCHFSSTLPIDFSLVALPVFPTRCYSPFSARGPHVVRNIQTLGFSPTPLGLWFQFISYFCALPFNPTVSALRRRLPCLGISHSSGGIAHDLTVTISLGSFFQDAR